MISIPERLRKPDPLSPGLYVVATPIGNLADWTGRAQEVIAQADHVACEDARVSGKLLQAYGLTVSLTPYHDHSKAAVRDALVERIVQGQAVALISDAGTPLIADPGYKLVRAVQEAGCDVIPIPGPSAVIAALSVSGLATDRFSFLGFVPAKAAARRTFLSKAVNVPGTLIFYESANRTAQTLADMLSIFGDREAALAREVTKKFETIWRAPLTVLVARVGNAETFKGEVVLMVAEATESPDQSQELDRLLTEALGDLSVKEAAAAVAWTLKLPRRQVYQRAIALKDHG